MPTEFRLGRLKGRDLLDDLGIDRKIILEWNLGKQDGKVGTECIWLKIRTSGRQVGSCEHGNEL
jgi:hypothetical protein